jgi:hypothetical protein
MSARGNSCVNGCSVDQNWAEWLKTIDSPSRHFVSRSRPTGFRVQMNESKSLFSRVFDGVCSDHQESQAWQGIWK